MGAYDVRRGRRRVAPFACGQDERRNRPVMCRRPGRFLRRGEILPTVRGCGGTTRRPGGNRQRSRPAGRRNRRGGGRRRRSFDLRDRPARPARGRHGSLAPCRDPAAGAAPRSRRLGPPGHRQRRPARAVGGARRGRDGPAGGSVVGPRGGSHPDRSLRGELRLLRSRTAAINIRGRPATPPRRLAERAAPRGPSRRRSIIGSTAGRGCSTGSRSDRPKRPGGFTAGIRSACRKPRGRSPAHRRRHAIPRPGSEVTEPSAAQSPKSR
jgi:hypothetical protein